MTYPNALYSAFAFIGFILSFIPFAWHLEGKRPIQLNIHQIPTPINQPGILVPVFLWHGQAWLVSTSLSTLSSGATMPSI